MVAGLNGTLYLFHSQEQMKGWDASLDCTFATSNTCTCCLVDCLVLSSEEILFGTIHFTIGFTSQSCLNSRRAECFRSAADMVRNCSIEIKLGTCTFVLIHSIYIEVSCLHLIPLMAVVKHHCLRLRLSGFEICYEVHLRQTFDVECTWCCRNQRLHHFTHCLHSRVLNLLFFVIIIWSVVVLNFEQYSIQSGHFSFKIAWMGSVIGSKSRV